MKKFFLFILVLLVCISCGTTKKLQQADDNRKVDSTAVVKNETKKSQTHVDTTMNHHGKVTITEIEFFPPDSSGPTEKQEAKQGANAKMDSFGNVNGDIKSIKQTVIESNLEKKGASDESHEAMDVEKSSAVKKDEAKAVKNVEPTGDPYKWRYIFYLVSLLVAVAVFLYIKRVPILNWIKKILSGIRRIF